jgi:glycosyltransferase involved in cell wall biosynthesis
MSEFAPLAADSGRPFWSVMIPTYRPNRDFLRQALAGVLAQDPGSAEMEIAIVDDGSPNFDPDDVRDSSMRRRVNCVRREHGGIGENWNACIREARGHWVHILHQDDLVLPGFYARLRAGFETVPGVGAAFCRDVVIDDQGATKWRQVRIRETPGIVDDWVEHLFVALHLRAPALVVRRQVYEALGGFRLDLDYALDWDMWKRIAAAYSLWYEPEVLACYRRHHASASFWHMRSGENIAQIGRSIELSHGALPPAIAADVTRRTRRNYTRYAVESAWRTLMDGDVASSWAQVRAARRISSTAAVALEIGRFLPRARRMPR